MKIVIIGGTGRLGSALAGRFVGEEVVAAAPSTGVDAVTGAGLDEALTGADVVIDVSNAPAFDDESAMNYFTTATGNLLAAARRAGIGNYVIVSIVGADTLPDSGYLRAKVAQERLVRGGGIPYSIVRATQFAEFADTIVAAATVNGEVRVPDANLELIAAGDLADYVAHIASGAPLNGTVEVGGPQAVSFADVARSVVGDAVPVVVDPAAHYFGTALGPDSLVSGSGAHHGRTTLEQVRAR